MLNPITFTEDIVSDFLRYQLTTYPFTDPGLRAQMRALLSLDETRRTPLLRGPYISLSRSFRPGARVEQLVTEGIVHPLIPSLTELENLYGHQETAIRSIHDRRHTLVSTGTGSGKTECFLFPAISKCLALRDEGAPAGVSAVIVYPMNALAEDQLGRLRELLAGTGVSFGLYVGKTPEREAQVMGLRLPAGASRADYLAAVERTGARRAEAVHPPEERVSREDMRTPGRQPRVLLTNVKQLELLLTRRSDVELFADARLDFLVFDEAHTFRGAGGAETACLVRRLRAHCGKGPDDTLCVATSATLADPDTGDEAGQEFAARFFGVPSDRVALIGEDYERDDWAAERMVPAPPSGDPRRLLHRVLEAVSGVETDAPDSEADDSAIAQLSSVVEEMTGSELPPEDWSAALHGRLSESELVFQIAELLQEPRGLADLVVDLRSALGRDVCEEEVLAWLALGAVARRNERPLLRPVVHAFVRGVDSAAVGFPPDAEGPQLWLSMTDAHEDHAEGVAFLRVLTCTTCGQHYFEHSVLDFEFSSRRPGGGEMAGETVFWRPLEEALGGNRLLLLDKSIVARDEESDGSGHHGQSDMGPVWLCATCGALHASSVDRCLACGAEGRIVGLLAVRQAEDAPGRLSRCVACGSHGRRIAGQYREPARPVRATTVSDVHVLAQNMLHHGERRRLLVFADNRQDAAFQAGWMQDHARRFRLRALMLERIEAAGEPGISVGDLVHLLDEHLEGDDELSRALIPEAWDRARKESEGAAHARERTYLLRIHVLREIATGLNQRIGLEPWGRLLVDYEGLTADLEFIGRWAERLECSPARLLGGVCSLLDRARRNMILYDRSDRVFSKMWSENDYEIQFGYMPQFKGVPSGLKLKRAAADSKGRVKQWLSDHGETLARNAARSWGVPNDEVDQFLAELWELATEELRLLVPVTLEGHFGALSGCSGIYQIDVDRLRLKSHSGRYKCTRCQQTNNRATPGDRCIAWRCDGTVAWEDEPKDDYDLQVLDERYAMLRPREHSGQIPGYEREILERAFKGEGELVNTLVCTPTLELGVDIGSLDAVLMRNVPPLPANYWQRAGRAGRRHRMAVSITYARPASHDRAYFAEPLKMLGGRVLPPAFNLRNPLLVRCHVHSAVLGYLHQLAANENGELSQEDRLEIADALDRCFPKVVRRYLFDERGEVLAQPLNVSELNLVVTKHQARLEQHVADVFAQGWPLQDSEVVSQEALRSAILEMAGELAQVIGRLHRRLHWALAQLDRLEQSRSRKGVLDPEEQAQRWRCERLVRRLKSQRPAGSNEQGIDDVWTYGVLAAEGYLPGYGLETGSIVAYHQAAHGSGRRDWTLRRSPALALREYVPGNLVYAAGERYLPRVYHLGVAEESGQGERIAYQVDVEHEALAEVGMPDDASAVALGAAQVTAVPMCDVDVPQNTHITDDEDYRFQMSVAIYGLETGRHSGGRAYEWGTRNAQHRRSVHLRLVNVGASALAQSGERLGYPVCLVCGYSVSPLSSEAQRKRFADDHLKRCGKAVDPVGFYADIVADCLSLSSCDSRSQAHTVAEALRRGAAETLDMEVDDLQVLVIGRAGREKVDAILYDPMPGGSGLLDQMLERWPEVVEAARGVLDCPSNCEAACIDCLMTYRNAYAHRYFDRHAALDAITEWGNAIQPAHAIPETHTVGGGKDDGEPTNLPEQRLAGMLERAGFSEFQAQRRIDLPKPYGYTVPDFYYEDPYARTPGVCIYLDGLSRHIHGNPATAKRDRQIRSYLRSEGYEVRSIAASDLNDRGAMASHFFWLGQRLVGSERAKHVRDAAADWFEESGE